MILNAYPHASVARRNLMLSAGSAKVCLSRRFWTALESRISNAPSNLPDWAAQISLERQMANRSRIRLYNRLRSFVVSLALWCWIISVCFVSWILKSKFPNCNPLASDREPWLSTHCAQGETHKIIEHFRSCLNPRLLGILHSAILYSAFLQLTVALRNSRQPDYCQDTELVR